MIAVRSLSSSAPSSLADPLVDEQLQERKTKVIQGALGQNKDKNKKQLAEDLAMIFADD